MSHIWYMWIPPVPNVGRIWTDTMLLSGDFRFVNLLKCILPTINISLQNYFAHLRSHYLSIYHHFILTAYSKALDVE